jgi:hypothetical protein
MAVFPMDRDNGFVTRHKTITDNSCTMGPVFKHKNAFFAQQLLNEGKNLYVSLPILVATIKRNCL